MNKIFEFIRRERLYILLLVFIILINILTMLSPESESKGKVKEESAAAQSVSEKKSEREDIFLKRENVEKILEGNRTLAALFSLASLLILAVITLGVAIDAILISFRLAKKGFDIQTYRLKTIRWNVLDVARVAILFLFFGYMIIAIESAIWDAFPPVIRSDNFRMILNSSILDILAVIFIIYFTVGRYKEELSSLGLSVKNFFKNVFYGIVGYIATVPILVAVLIVISIMVNLTKYVPEKQPVVELFLREKNAPFLLYTSLFASLVGPFIEELFFRAFMYKAFKKVIGIFWATAFTAAVFAALHTNVVGFLPIFVLGILLAYLYEKTGTLVSSIAAHITHNLSMVFLVFLIKQLQ